MKSHNLFYSLICDYSKSINIIKTVAIFTIYRHIPHSRPKIKGKAQQVIRPVFTIIRMKI